MCKVLDYELDSPNSMPGVGSVEIFLHSSMFRLVLGVHSAFYKIITGLKTAEHRANQ